MIATMRSWVLALLTLCACGDVNKAPPDARPLDAYQPDAAFSCGTGEMVCGGACANVMTSSQHCGGCATQCSPTQVCGAGTCRQPTTCNEVRSIYPGAPSGAYPVGAPGTFYCDFANGKTYDDFRIYDFSQVPTGFTVARATDFQNPAFASAFVWFYNRYGGIRSYMTFSSMNCCFTTVAGSRILFGGSLWFPGLGTTDACNIAGGYVTDTAYTISPTQGTGFLLSLPPDYFTTHPATEAANCSDSTNPAIFFKRRDSLD